jgi:predicted NBD/HSP70 family sugar kinase
MADTPAKIARGLTIYGDRLHSGKMKRPAFVKKMDIDPGLYRGWVRKFSTGSDDIDESHFLTHPDQTLKFGPGAGLVLGISLGTTSLRSALVDANGHTHYADNRPMQYDQLKLHPKDLLERIEESATAVMEPALDDKALLVNEKLRFRGVSVAWPCPLDRQKRPRGNVFSNKVWSNKPLTERVSGRLKLDQDRCHAINDCWAAAVGVAFDHTRALAHAKQDLPELTVVLRIAGGVSAATIVVEPPQGEAKSDRGRESGFGKSILLGGIDAHAGELGHALVPPSTIAERRESPQKGLGPLEPLRCSCTPAGEEVPAHLEAFVSRSALAQRVAPDRPPEEEQEIVDKVLSDSTAAVHKRALEDIGVLIADSLQSAVWILNPAHIKLTGSLAHPVVCDAMDKRLENDLEIIRHPEIGNLEGTENDLIRARGAALVVLRRQVYRKLDEITGAKERDVNELLMEDIEELDELPWV